MTTPRISYAHLLTEPNPKHVESLVKFFESGCQERGTGGFGVEIEHLPVHNSDDTAVNYYEENGIEALLNRIRPYYDESKEYWENGRLVGLGREGISVSLEPGGQLRYAGAQQRLAAGQPQGIDAAGGKQLHQMQQLCIGKLLQRQRGRLLRAAVAAAQAVQVAFQRFAKLFGGAVQHHFQNAGVRIADGLVLVGLRAELADALHVLQLAEHMVKMCFHAGDLKRLAVELVVQLQQAGLPVRLGLVGLQ